MARVRTAGDWGEPPQDMTLMELRSSWSTRGLFTSMVNMVEATLVEVTRSRSERWEAGRGGRDRAAGLHGPVGREGRGARQGVPANCLWVRGGMDSVRSASCSGRPRTPLPLRPTPPPTDGQQGVLGGEGGDDDVAAAHQSDGVHRKHIHQVEHGRKVAPHVLPVQLHLCK